ncbi:thiosulfate oxidation carrier complex protein SoxZ [Candidatus Parabeggiatoa sp. HSG14]|uniref:thiosulfate oxidation carrier complex protein SoxZ n=1 Tax=Candidatus Parabeggiatoa sp. HSG14 TaxID=3055593 RepID=UPI0025A7AD71|nr:thiosulfate oxidation carrier complex protein SoxZ [Thiotrichales bacterium HSG14]
MSTKTRMRAKLKKGFTKVKVLIKHPMKPGKEDKAGNIIEEPHFIEEITCEHNGELIMSADLGAGVSADPFFAFEFEDGKAGDLVKVAWRDNQGNTDEVVSKIK